MPINFLSALRNFRDTPMIKQQRRLQDLIGEGWDRCCEKGCFGCEKVGKIRKLRGEIGVAMKVALEMPQLTELIRKKELCMINQYTENSGRIAPQGVVIGYCTNEGGSIFEIAYDEKKKDKSAFTIIQIQSFIYENLQPMPK